ncbi:2196_t:CDS:10 [Acaulospora morrowiae]|uniref:ubiquitinyl hydrolase 1 n=1 Tax=Acaulospora morrowiae TaxID=94023 RepID=A0A9N9BN98_9GLOM|nr:2196_t:CDS:10 [Acaulospora morrowiae]
MNNEVLVPIYVGFEIEPADDYQVWIEYKMSLLKWIGMGPSGKTATSEAWSSGTEKYFGLENILTLAPSLPSFCLNILSVRKHMALYFCKPFRECVINFPTGPVSLSVPPSQLNTQSSTITIVNGIASKKEANGGGDNKINGDQHSTTAQGIEDTLFGALKDLFCKINSQKKRTGVLAPNHFITKLKKENELFRSTMHQDAHEFLNFVLNAIAENVMEQQKRIEEAERQQREQEQQSDINEKSRSGNEENGNTADGNSSKGSEATSSMTSSSTTWVHQIFEGTLTNETKCLTCETVTSRDESFLDLSIDIEQNSSVTSCLRQFSASEILCHKNKFFCDVCCGLQEAEKRMKIKKLPNVLALHLKRFKYQEKLQRYIKLSYRVVFPFELRLFNTCDNIEDPDRLYELYAICVHIGSGPYHGHYVTLIKSMGQWLLFDDDNVEPIDEADIQKYFGDLPGAGSGYVLFYQACDLDLNSLGLLNAVWANSHVSGSSSSSAEFDGSAETNDPLATDAVVPINGTDNNPQLVTGTEESRSDRKQWLLSGRKKDHNTPDRRKSHADADNYRENEDGQNHSHEKERSWFGVSRSNSNIGSTNHKKDKKAEKEGKKKEKKLKSEKKLDKLSSAGTNETI